MPLLLKTDYGGGPLWLRSADNKFANYLAPDSLHISEPLQARLLAWAEGYHHLGYQNIFGVEFDDPAYEQAWHDEGLALLGDLRTELGTMFDIKFAHDLDA